MSETVENLSTLKINYLTQEQYDAAVSSGIIQENELYLTPTSGEQSALPSGGLMGQVLAKSSDDDYAVAWATLSDSDSTFTIHAPRGVHVSTITEPFSDIVAAISAGKNIVLIDGLTKREYSLYEYANNYAYFAWSKTNSVGSNSDYAEINYMNVYVKQATNSEAAICSRMKWGAKTLYTGPQIKAIVLPQGGSTDQILAKSSNDDYAVAWTTIHDIPAGGSAGQVLAKSSNDNYAVAWSSIDAGMKVTVTKSGSTYSADKTFAEITNALNNNINVYVVYSNYVYFLSTIESSYISFTYKNIDNYNYTINQRSIFIYSSGNVSYSSTNTPIPSLTEVANSLMLVIEKTTNNNTVSYSIDGLQAAWYPSQNFERYFYDLYNRGSSSYYLQAKIYEKKTNYDSEAGYSETLDNNFELYDLADAWFDSKWDDDIGSYGYFPHFRFTRIYDDNGIKKLATLSVDAKDNASWNPGSEDVSDIYYSVSYSEEQLGGVATLVVNITQSGSTFSSDTSISQIHDAFLDGKQIYAKYVYGIYQLSSLTNYEACFTMCTVGTNNIDGTQIRVYNSNGNTRVAFLGKSLSTLKRYTFYFTYDSSQNTYSYEGCSEGDESSFFWENSDSVGNACLVVSYSNASNDPVNETAWVQKQEYAYETIDGDMLPIARVHFTNLSVSTMMITDYEMVWNLNDTFMKLNVTKIPIGGSISGVSF